MLQQVRKCAEGQASLFASVAHKLCCAQWQHQQPFYSAEAHGWAKAEIKVLLK